jgi:hypothetical protein
MSLTATLAALQQEEQLVREERSRYLRDQIEYYQTVRIPRCAAPYEITARLALVRECQTMQEELCELETRNTSDLDDKFQKYHDSLRIMTGVDPSLAQTTLHDLQKHRPQHTSAQAVMAPKYCMMEEAQETARTMNRIGGVDDPDNDDDPHGEVQPELWLDVAVRAEGATRELQQLRPSFIQGKKKPTLFESRSQLCTACGTPLNMHHDQHMSVCPHCSSTFEQPAILPTARFFVPEANTAEDQRQKQNNIVADPEALNLIARLACYGDAVPTDLMNAVTMLLHFMGVQTPEQITLGLVAFVLGIVRRTPKEITNARNQVFCRLTGRLPPRMSRELGNLVKKYLFSTNMVWEEFRVVRDAAEAEVKALPQAIKGLAAVNNAIRERLPDKYKEAFAWSLKIPRHKAPSIEYRLFKIWQLLGQERFCGFLLLPHRMDQLEACDGVWRSLVCQELDWEFIPTVTPYTGPVGATLVVPETQVLLQLLESLKPLQTNVHKLVNQDLATLNGARSRSGAGNTPATSFKVRSTKLRLLEQDPDMHRRYPIGDMYEREIIMTGQHAPNIRRWMHMIDQKDRTHVQQVVRGEIETTYRATKHTILLVTRAGGC